MLIFHKNLLTYAYVVNVWSLGFLYSFHSNVIFTIKEAVAQTCSVKKVFLVRNFAKFTGVFLWILRNL